MSEYIRRLQEAITSSIYGMDREDLLRKPDAKWSAAEVLEHLYLSYTGTVKGFERTLATGKLSITPQTSKQKLQVLVAITLGYFPGGRQAPEQVRPKGTPVEQVVDNITQQVAAMDAVIARCELRFGKGKLVNHPVLGALTGKQWRKFHWIHGRHHARQIVELRRKFAEKEKAPVGLGA